MPKRKHPILHENDLITDGVKWVDVPGYEESYIISELGDVISKQRTVVAKNGIITLKGAKKIKPAHKKNGYVYITLKNGIVYETKRLHRLVAQAFIPNPNNLEQVNHIDGDKKNNKVSNLEWCSQSQNVQHAYDNGLLNHYKRPVLKIDLTSGDIVGEFESLKDASDSVDAKSSDSARSCIYLCCNEKLNSAYGYAWKYKSAR